MSIDQAPQGRAGLGTSDRTSESPSASSDPLGKRQGLLYFCERYGLPSALIVVVAVFCVVSPGVFATTANWQSLAATCSVPIVLSVALLIPLTSGSFDLSIGSNAILCSVACASMMAFHGWSLFESCIATIAIGSLAGMLNGILISIGNLNGIIATLGTGAIMSALVLWYTNNASVSSPLSSTLLNIGSRHFLGVPRIAFIALVIAIVVGILMTQTPYGRMLTSIGSNRRAARLVGVRVKRTVLLSFVLSGAIASIAGILLIAQQGSSNPSQDGLSLILPAITALFLGAAAFYPGQYNVPGAVTGLVLVNALVSGLTIVGVASWVQPLCNGLALIIGVGASALLRAKRLGGDEA